MPTMSIRKYLYYFQSIFLMLIGIEDAMSLLSIFLRSPDTRSKVIRLKRSGLIFQVRGPMDVWSIKETFLDQFYKKFGTPIEDGWTIVDIGAGIGEFTLYAAQGHPNNVIYAFEPFDESFALLQTNLNLNHATGIQAFNEAIGSESGVFNLSTSVGEPLQFSTVKPSSSNQAITVPGVSLKEAFNRLQLQHCNLLKLDCEGAEYEILFNAPDSVLNCIDQIVMEYHDDITGYNHLQLAEFLTTKGYQVKIQNNYVHANLGYLHAYR